MSTTPSFFLTSRGLVICLNHHTIVFYFLFATTNCPLLASNAQVLTTTRYMHPSEDFSSVSLLHDRFLSALILYLFVTKTCHLFSNHALFFLLANRGIVIFLYYHTIVLCFLFATTPSPLLASHVHVLTTTIYMLPSEDLLSASSPHDRFLSASRHLV